MRRPYRKRRIASGFVGAMPCIARPANVILSKAGEPTAAISAGGKNAAPTGIKFNAIPARTKCNAIPVRTKCSADIPN